MYDNSFLSELPADRIQAGLLITRKFLDFDSQIVRPINSEKHSDYLEAFAILEAFIKSNSFKFSIPTITSNKKQNYENIISFYNDFHRELKRIKEEINLEFLRRKYSSHFETGFKYIFSDGDLERIQKLINELRDIIGKSKIIDEKHKERLLMKLEALQKELHKKMSSLDKIWGLIGEAGIVLGKFGKDVKPLVDRIREIVQIGWRTQARAEELPSDSEFPVLPSNDNE